MKGKNSGAVTITACVIVELCLGILYVWSILKMDAMEFYGWDKGAANLVASFMLFAFCAGNLIGGAINDRIGPKKTCYPGIIFFAAGVFLASCLRPGAPVYLFYLSYCILGGLGSGIAYGALLSCIQKWLPHKIGLATGIATSTFGFGTFGFSTVIAAMLKAMPINTVLRILSIVFIVVCLGASLFIKLPDEAYLASLPKPQNRAVNLNREDIPLSRAVKTVPFWCMMVSCFFYNGVWNMLNPLIKDLGMSRGLTETAAILCVSLTGVFNASGRFILSALSDRIGRIGTMFILCIVTCCCGLLLTGIGGPAYLVIVLLTAFVFGGPAAIHPAIVSDFFGLKYTGTNYGVVMLGLGFSSLFFNFVSNKMYAATGTYKLTFIMGAASALVALGSMAVIRYNLKKREARNG